jgi:predicted TIM-barrel fold metal-dependent hydrolase
VRRVDFHVHLLPDEYVAVLPDPARMLLPLPMPSRENLEAMMARCAIDAAVLSIGPPGAYFGDQGRANETARAANEGLAKVVRDDPSRFGALALLPLPDVASALAETAYALDVLGLDGVNLMSSVAGTYPGDPAWEPLLAELSRRGAYVYLHPGIPPYTPPLARVHPVWMYEVPFETTRAVCNLIYSGTLDRHPGVRWQLAHMGGDVPFLADRLASLADRQPDKAAGAARGLLAYLGDFYYDTGLSNSAPALAATFEVTPRNHVVFGTDWPYCALPDSGEPFPGLAVLDAGERALVESGNGSFLVPRLYRDDAIS